MSLFPSLALSSLGVDASPEKDVDTTTTATADTTLDTTFDSAIGSSSSTGGFGFGFGFGFGGPATDARPPGKEPPGAAAERSPERTTPRAARRQQKRDDDSPYRRTATVRLEPQGDDVPGVEVDFDVEAEAAAAPEAAPEAEAATDTATDTDTDTSISTREVDYDVSPTRLYMLIEKRKWDQAERYLTETLSPADATAQASTWVVRREKKRVNGVAGVGDGANNNGGGGGVIASHGKPSKIRWRLLPLHGAIIFNGPTSLVRALVSVYKGGCRCPDDRGMTPLHLAFRNDAPDEIINVLLSASACDDPGSAVRVEDVKGRTPLSCALANGNCTRKTRAVLLDAYSAASVSAERQRLTEEVEGGYEAVLADMRVAHEGRLIENRGLEKERDDGRVREETVRKELEAALVREEELAAKVKEMMEREKDDAMARDDVLRTELVASQGRESDLTAKVTDLSRALTAVSTLRRSETERFHEESSQWSRVSRDLIAKMTAVESERDSVAEEADLIRTEKDASARQEDALRDSIDGMVSSHRTLQAERDELASRNADLARLVERNLTEQDGLHAIFSRLDADMSAAATVRERMVAVIAKQEADVYALAEREHSVMRGILSRQRGEMESCLLRSSSSSDGNGGASDGDE